jgi:hypothetical protein
VALVRHGATNGIEPASARSRHGEQAPVAPYQLTGLSFLKFRGSRRFLWKLEPDFTVFQFQVRGEGAAAFRDKGVEEIGLSCGEKLSRLHFWNLTAEDRFAQLEFARLTIGL